MSGLKTARPGSIISAHGEDTMAKDRWQESKEKWKKDNLKLYSFRLSKVSEKDMIDFLAEKQSVYSYIKDLIRKDMELSKQQ